jgi:hypothetical protein
VVAWDDTKTWHAKRDLDTLADFEDDFLRDLIAKEREQGRAYGQVAEAARHELARRGHANG